MATEQVRVSVEISFDLDLAQHPDVDVSSLALLHARDIQGWFDDLDKRLVLGDGNMTLRPTGYIEVTEGGTIHAISYDQGDSGVAIRRHRIRRNLTPKGVDSPQRT
jgi:hypothetical protein